MKGKAGMCGEGGGQIIAKNKNKLKLKVNEKRKSKSTKEQECKVREKNYVYFVQF